MGKTCSDCGKAITIDYAKPYGIKLRGFRVCADCAFSEREFKCPSCNNNFVAKIGDASMSKCPICAAKIKAIPGRLVPTDTHHPVIQVSGTTTKSGPPATTVGADCPAESGLSRQQTPKDLSTPPATAPKDQKNPSSKPGCIILIIMIVGLVLAIRACIYREPSEECQKAKPCFNECNIYTVAEVISAERLKSIQRQRWNYCIESCEAKFGVELSECYYHP